MAGSTRNNPFEIDPRSRKKTVDLSLDRFEVVRFVAQVGGIVVVLATSHGPRIVVSFTLVVFHPSNSGKQHWLDHIGLPYEWRHYFKRLSVGAALKIGAKCFVFSERFSTFVAPIFIALRVSQSDMTTQLIRSLLFNLKAEFIELLCLNGGSFSAVGHNGELT